MPSCHDTAPLSFIDYSIPPFNGIVKENFSHVEVLHFNVRIKALNCQCSALLAYHILIRRAISSFIATLISMNRCTKGAVRLVFDRLEKRMGSCEFASVFEYILTDRGSEFGDPAALETGVTGIQRSSIYYCDPMQSGQKGGLEQAHTMLRMILPKGTSFEFLTQWDVNLIVNHINSTPRECLGGRTPYSMALETLGKETLNAFQLRSIEPDQVNLTPKLIRFNH